jgi:hypothetical protein
LVSWCRCCHPARKDRTGQAFRPFSSRCLGCTRILAATLDSQCSSNHISSSFQSSSVHRVIIVGFAIPSPDQETRSFSLRSAQSRHPRFLAISIPLYIGPHDDDEDHSNLARPFSHVFPKIMTERSGKFRWIQDSDQCNWHFRTWSFENVFHMS